MSDISFSKYLLLGALTFVFVGLLTPIMRKIAISIGAVDAPTLERKAQKEPVPYLGGVAIAIGITVASFAALLYSDFSTETFGKALSVALKNYPKRGCIFICDAEFIQKYGLGMVRPKGIGLKNALKNGYLKSATTIKAKDDHRIFLL